MSIAAPGSALKEIDNFLKTIKRSGLGKNLFHELRYDLNGNVRNDFVLNWEPYKNSKILYFGKGCKGGPYSHHPARTPI